MTIEGKGVNERMGCFTMVHRMYMNRLVTLPRLEYRIVGKSFGLWPNIIVNFVNKPFSIITRKPSSMMGTTRFPAGHASASNEQA